MKKTVFILISVFLLSACGAIGGEDKTAMPSLDGAEQAEQTVPALESEKNGITVTVENVRKTDGQTSIALTIDNHLYDVSQMDVAGLSSLNGEKSVDYQVLEITMGGHHVKADIVFPGEASGNLVIGLKPDLSFDFQIP